MDQDQVLFEMEPIHFPDHGAWLVKELVEDEDGILVRATLYAGRPEPLKTPEIRLHFHTTASAEEWAESYARQFMSGED